MQGADSQPEAEPCLPMLDGFLLFLRLRRPKLIDAAGLHPLLPDTRALGRQARLEWQKLVPAERRAFHDQALAAAAAAVASGNDAVEPPPTPKRKSGQSPAPAAEAPATPRQAGGRQRAASGSLAPTPSTPSGPATSTSDGDEADTAAAAVQSGAKAAEPPLPEAKPKVAPRRPRAAAKPATKAVGTAAKLAAMSVGALRAKAKYMGVSKHEVERCVEKRDLIELLTTVEKCREGNRRGGGRGRGQASNRSRVKK
mmetsp:Transcript_17823/g.39075  ORF Transcript_17823/g.39075 Transcript_17823/m.39075 type:complete len:255 (-) Transcript_17823:36-800(-)